MNIIIFNNVKTSLKTIRVLLIVAFFMLHASCFTLMAQEVIVNPDISYAGTPRPCLKRYFR